MSLITLQDDFSGLNQISPLQANLALRPSTYIHLCSNDSSIKFHGHVMQISTDEPQHFDLEVRPSNNYPIDLYLLMDLSYSMRDDLKKLKTLGAQLCKYLNKS